MKDKLQMKKSLVRLGHGKWKSALRHTLLIIGMVLMSMGAFAQTQTSPEMTMPSGLVMEKKWQPTNSTGSQGNILVETYVTGHSVATHVPTDIVLVLDVSGSMDERLYEALESQAYSYNSYGNNTYYYYYESDQAYYEVTRHSYGSSYYWLTFERNNRTYYLTGTTASTQFSYVNSATATIWTGVLYEQGQTKMQALQTSVGLFVDIIATDATNFNVDHRISIVKYACNRYFNDDETNIEEGDHEYTWSQQGYQTLYDANYTEVVINRRDPRTEAQNIKTAVNSLHASGSTAADYGMNKARYLLASIPANEFATRNKVVVMFTDGSPTYTNGFDTNVADNTISYANQLKNSGTVSGSSYTFEATVFSVGVFDNETTQIRTYMNRVSSNYPNATGMGNNQGGTQASSDYYFKAESAGGLSDIFESIAGASGAMTLPASTIVQDVVSPSFHLPAGASGTVTAYAPLCTNYDEATGVYTFASLNDGGTLTLTVNADGVVTGGTENKLPANFVRVEGSQIQMEGFNFSEHWCGWEEDDHGNKVIHGRKIVIKIPVEINEGLWGDGMQTNDPANSYIYNQSTGEYYGPFNNLTADVQGDVWTEIVVQEPEGFDPMNIDSPEDLAWFISVVNGRLNYEAPHNTNAPQWSTNGKLTADIDMSAHNWVPIGSGSGHGVGGYTGTFDGNGHVITGLKNNASKYYKMETEQHPDGVAVVFPGMFSKVGNGGVVKNVFVLDTDFRGKHHTADFVHHGIIADTLLAGGQIFNCEAAGRITCNNDDPTADQNLIYGGLVGLNQGTIHSCMAMVELTGYTMGGMIGENGKNGTNGTFSNGFTNGVYNYLGSDNTYKVGGIAGINPGTIDNCYVRFERNNTNLNTADFGMLVGDGTEPTNGYIPQIVTWSRPDYLSSTTEVTTNLTVPLGTVLHPAGNPTNSYTLSVSPSFYNMFTNDNMTGGTWGELTIQGVTYNVYNSGTPLLTKLNANKGSGASWKRTTAGAYSDGAGDINDDYPVLQFDDFKCLGSSDGIRIDYATSLNEMLHRHNNGNFNENTNLVGNKYKPTNHEAIYKGAINLYANDDVTLDEQPSGKDGEVADNCTAQGVVVYIDEDISLLQDDDSEIEAYTCQTLKSFVPDGKERWHFISSSLEDSQFGWNYGQTGEHNWEEDPCEIALAQEDEDHAFFPIDLISYKRMDFYCFYEPQYHWINFKRKSDSHYHMDDWDAGIPITYNNETTFTPGKGYLMSIDMSTWASYGRNAQFFQNRGTLTNGTFTYSESVSCTAANEWTGLMGYNLLGNPYQSYLDFTTFAWENSSLWDNEEDMTFAIYDPSIDSYVQGMAGEQPSEGAMASTGDINMHQGFLIRVSNGGNATFNNDMRSNTPADGTHFRGERPTYPLINFILTDNKDNTDIAVLELNRPENSGALKLRAGEPNGRIYFKHDNTNMAIFFRDNAEGYQSLHFAAEENGNFTLNWNTANAEFSSLTLVDNITGVKTDMLTHDHYTFEGNTNDYTSRFKIVFGTVNNEEEEGSSTGSETFAFFNEGNLIVNGEGRLDVIDVLGRVVYSAELTDTQNTVSLPYNAKGVCVLRLTNGDNVKVQRLYVR